MMIEILIKTVDILTMKKIISFYIWKFLLFRRSTLLTSFDCCIVLLCVVTSERGYFLLKCWFPSSVHDFQHDTLFCRRKLKKKCFIYSMKKKDGCWKEYQYLWFKSKTLTFQLNAKKKRPMGHISPTWTIVLVSLYFEKVYYEFNSQKYCKTLFFKIFLL